MTDIPPVKPGDPIPARLYNAIAARLEKMLALTVAQGCGLSIQRGRGGRVLSLHVPRPIDAQLSGTASPYSWHQVEPTTGGGWSTFGQLAGTSNAYEINGKGGLSGKVVELWKTAAGDWRFAWEGVGPPTCNPATTGITFTVNGCLNQPLAGAVATVTQGSNTYTCTTNASGQCTIGLSSTTPYTWSVSYSSRLITVSGGPITPTCGHIVTQTVQLSAASGYTCCVSNSYPYANTTYLSTSGGTFTLTLNPSNLQWGGVLNVTVSSGVVAGSDSCSAPNPCEIPGTGTPGSGTVNITMFVDCLTGKVTEIWPASYENCNANGNCYALDVTGCTQNYPSVSSATASGNFDNTSPLPQTLTLPSAPPSGTTCAVPLTGSAVFSE